MDRPPRDPADEFAPPASIQPGEERARPFIGVTLDPETVEVIDAHAADMAGATGIPSRSRAVDDLVRIAVERKSRSKPKG